MKNVNFLLIPKSKVFTFFFKWLTHDVIEILKIKERKKKIRKQSLNHFCFCIVAIAGKLFLDKGIIYFNMLNNHNRNLMPKKIK